MEPRFTPAAVRPGHRKDTWQEAKVAVASFPGVNLAVHLIHVEHWSRTVLHGQEGSVQSCSEKMLPRCLTRCRGTAVLES